MKEKIKKNLVKIEELSKVSGVQMKILSSYVKKGLLFYSEQAENGIRYYDKGKTLENLEEIKKLEKEGYTAKEIKIRFNKEYLFKGLEDLED